MNTIRHYMIILLNDFMHINPIIWVIAAITMIAINLIWYIAIDEKVKNKVVNNLTTKVITFTTFLSFTSLIFRVIMAITTIAVY